MDYQHETSSPALARRFIEEEAPTLHRAFSIPTHFNEMTSRFEPQEVHKLAQSLKNVQDRSPELFDFESSGDLSECTWDDVLEELDKARAAAHEVGNRRRSPSVLRSMVRAMVANFQATGGPSLSIIPRELNILHGGLALIFSMARHRDDNRTKIMRSFEDVPNAIMMAQAKLRNFPPEKGNPDSVGLQLSVQKLQETLLRALPELIVLLNKRTLSGFAQCQPDGRRIDELLIEVQTGTEKVKVCGEAARERREGETHHFLTGELREHLFEMLRRQETIQDTLDSIAVKNDVFRFLVEQDKSHDAMNGPHRPSTSSAYSSSPDGSIWLSSSPTAVSSVGIRSTLGRDSISRGVASNSAPEPQAVSSAPAAATVAAASPDLFLALLDERHLGSAGDDEKLVQKRGHSMDSSVLSNAVSMTSTEQVQRLLHGGSSDVVLVEALGDRARVSPISHVCANLALSLRRRGRSSTTALVFFCGLHIDAEDGNYGTARTTVAAHGFTSGERVDEDKATKGLGLMSGPDGLMRSLVAQLVRVILQNRWWTRTPPGAPQSLESYYPESPPSSLQDVCELFYRLTGLVPAGHSLFCILDGISHLEREHWRADFDLVMRTFGAVIADTSSAGPERSCNFKLLMTSPTRCERLAAEMQPDQHVRLRRDSSGGGRGGGVGRGGDGTVERSVLRAAQQHWEY